MSYNDGHGTHDAAETDSANDDSATDAIAAVSLILIAVCAVIYWVSGQ